MYSVSKFFLAILMKILTYGEVPRHIAFIPDNNRTFSKKKNVGLLSSYLKGQRVLYEQLEWSVSLKTSCISFYLLSTHNLKRNDYEKRCVFDAIFVFFQKLLIHPMNCRFQIIGDVSVLPRELRELCNLLTSQTKDNDGILVNVALNYSGKEELIDVSHLVLNRFYQHDVDSEDIDENSFEDFIYTKHSPDVDLTIRTTNNKRLSEFLLWQNTNSILHFVDIYWPEMTGWHLLVAVFLYQYHKRKIF